MLRLPKKPKKCAVLSCPKLVPLRFNRELCNLHNKICTYVDKKTGLKCCTHGAIGSTKLCMLHGGGHRCEYVSDTGLKCTHGAQGSTKLCKLHGGGHRCEYVSDTGLKCCTHSAIGSTKFCILHGGGHRCEYVSDTGLKCTHGAQGSTKFCILHGGGHRCEYVSETGLKCCTHGAQGSTKFCILHGGGHTCNFDDCNKPVSISTANYYYEDNNPSKFYCPGCFRFHFPQHPKTLQSKEKMVATVLTAKFQNLIWIHNKKFKPSKHRPDHLVLLISQSGRSKHQYIFIYCYYILILILFM